MDEARVTVDHMMALARDAVPLAHLMGFEIDTVEPGYVVGRVPYRSDFVRPGGTVAGPVMMALADFVMWGVVLSLAGPSHMAVTSQLSINFLRRPAPGEIVARGNILKMGRRLAVGEVSIYSAADDELVAHVTSTYALPTGPQPAAGG